MTIPRKIMRLVVLVLVVIVVSACDGGGDNSGGSGSIGALGSSFTLPNGNVEDWSGEESSVWVHLWDAAGEQVLHSYSEGSISSSGYFGGIEIDTPPADSLLNSSEAEQVLQDLFGIDVAISDSSARGQAFEGLCLDDASSAGWADVYRVTMDAEIYYFYTDRDTRVSGSGQDSGYTITADVELKTGWNRVVATGSGSSVTVQAGPEPSGAVWWYW